MMADDDLWDEMPDLDDEVADALLDGTLAPDEVQLRYIDVAGLIRCARGPAAPWELASEAMVLDAMSAAVADDEPSHRTRPVGVVRRVLAAKAVAAVAIGVAGVAAAAATGGFVGWLEGLPPNGGVSPPGVTWTTNPLDVPPSSVGPGVDVGGAVDPAVTEVVPPPTEPSPCWPPSDDPGLVSPDSSTGLEPGSCQDAAEANPSGASPDPSGGAAGPNDSPPGSTVPPLAQGSPPLAPGGSSSGHRSSTGQTGSTPGQGGGTPGQGSPPPGSAGTSPGQSGATPGQTDPTPAERASPPVDGGPPAGVGGSRPPLP
jgi:hypothetical protein